VLGLVLALVPIVLAAVLGPAWLAVVVLAVVVGGVAARAGQLRMRKLRRPDLLVKMAPPHLGSAAERRALVVANDTLSEEALLSEIERLVSAPGMHVMLLVPAAVSAGARLTGAIDSLMDQAHVPATRSATPPSVGSRGSSNRSPGRSRPSGSVRRSSSPAEPRTEFRYGNAQVADLMPEYDETPAHSFLKLLGPANGLAPGDIAR
jgi:hypothetical protein